MNSNSIRMFARMIQRNHNERAARIRADYEAMLADCHRMGYRASHCIHGTYLWGDYDVMCNGCESSDYFLSEDMTFVTALREARDKYAARERRLKLLLLVDDAHRLDSVPRLSALIHVASDLREVDLVAEALLRGRDWVDAELDSFGKTW